MRARTENAYGVLVGKPRVMKPVGRDVYMGGYLISELDLYLTMHHQCR